MFGDETLNGLQRRIRTRETPRRCALGLQRLCRGRVVNVLGKLGINVVRHTKDALETVCLQAAVRFEQLPVEADIARLFLCHYHMVSNNT